MFGLRPDSNAADKKSERGGFGEGCRSTGEWERAHSCDYAYVMGDGGGGGRVGDEGGFWLWGGTERRKRGGCVKYRLGHRWF